MAVRPCLLLPNLLLFAACKGTAPDENSFRLAISRQGNDCIATIAGTSFDPRDEVALRAALKPYSDGKTEIKLVGDAAVPYRCIGSAIYTLQRDGHQKIGFIADPSEQKP